MVRRHTKHYDHLYYQSSTPIKTKGGVKIKSKKGEIAKKWWSKRFIEILSSYNLENRMDRGKRYARSGEVLRINIEKGKVSHEM